MKSIYLPFAMIALLLCFTSCKETKSEENIEEVEVSSSSSNDHSDHDHPHETDLNVGSQVSVTMNAKSGSRVSGTIVLEQGESEVMMKARIAGLTEGTHAIHVHEKGDCSSDDGKSAGGHWNPTNENHGAWGKDMHHSGDIGNLEANADGEATLNFSTDQWCLGCEDDTRNLIGKSFIIHAEADDFTTQPTGAAGGRVACGLIQ